MNSNIPIAIGLLEGLIEAYDITNGDIDKDGVKRVLKKAVMILYNEAPHLRPEESTKKQINYPETKTS